MKKKTRIKPLQKVRVRRHEGQVTDFNGKPLSSATFSPIFRGPFCRLIRVRFKHKGRDYRGAYCPDTTDSLKVKAS